MSEQDYIQSVNAHYTPGNLNATILNVLKANGKNPDQITADDLAPVDHLHSGGKGATIELAQLAGLQPGMQVLDVGGGMGGPARTFASTFDCQVTVLDLTESFVQAGEEFTRLTGLDQKVKFKLGNALAMPFEDQSFDRVFTQHATMNISDKPQLFSEIYRVLRPSGQYVFHDMMAGPNQPIHFPVPWAIQPDISFLIQPEEAHNLLTERGFKELVWHDDTADTLQWIKERLEGQQPGPPSAKPSLGLHLLFGANLKPMFLNLVRNIEEDRLKLIRAVFVKV